MHRPAENEIQSLAHWSENVGSADLRRNIYGQDGRSLGRQMQAMAALWITERCDRQAAATMLRTMRGGVLEVWAAATAAAGKKALSRCLVAAVAGRFDSQDQREGIDISLVERMADSPTSQPPQVLTTIVS